MWLLLNNNDGEWRSGGFATVPVQVHSESVQVFETTEQHLISLVDDADAQQKLTDDYELARQMFRKYSGMIKLEGEDIVIDKEYASSEDGDDVPLYDKLLDELK